MDPMNNSTQKEPMGGAMVSIIIVVLVIVAGAYYFWKRLPAQQGAATTQTEIDATADALSTQGTSDEIADIQKDLDTTPDTSTLGDGLGAF